MTLANAAESFTLATRQCDNLVEVHRGHGGPKKGRRDKEVSLNRAVVVLTVASWQAVVQDMTRAAVEAGTPGAGDALSPATYSLITGHVAQQIGDLSTPNAQNVRRLMQGAGFDPRPQWTWRQMGGQGVGSVEWSPAMAEARIDEWLKVRHAIAHGDAVLPAVPALQAVRHNHGRAPINPTLRLADAEQCLAFFRRLATITMKALAQQFGIKSPV